MSAPKRADLLSDGVLGLPPSPTDEVIPWTVDEMAELNGYSIVYSRHPISGHVVYHLPGGMSGTQTELSMRGLRVKLPKRPRFEAAPSPAQTRRPSASRAIVEA